MAAPEKPEQHLTVELLLDYFDDRLSDLEQAEIERHIADCAECVVLARRARQLSGAWDTWTAATHAEALKAQAARRTHEVLPSVKTGGRVVKKKSAVKRGSRDS